MLKEFLILLDRLGRERGQTLAEYTLILAFVVIGCILVLGLLALRIVGHIDSITIPGYLAAFT
jgi:Flp pilus assembly pilin Flp